MVNFILNCLQRNKNVEHAHLIKADNRLDSLKPDIEVNYKPNYKENLFVIANLDIRFTSPTDFKA